VLARNPSYREVSFIDEEASPDDVLSFGGYCQSHEGQLESRCFHPGGNPIIEESWAALA
jgi:hypothetical protein